ncbi:MAG: class I tRNA ligase family protein, partial [Oscillospiraceae bacterium]|nr:class I tRNA ligase family protein [Oscillospiraceae bacterium]
AQTAMYRILSAVARLIAPVLSFTAEEIWKFMPHTAQDDTESIFLNDMPEKLNLAVTPEFTAKWDTIYKLRAEATKALEVKRADKFIGASLEAKVTLHTADEKLYSEINALKDELPAVFIVSAADVVNNGEGEFKSENFDGKLSLSVERASGEKCERCWMYSETVGRNAIHPTLCERCSAEVMS